MPLRLAHILFKNQHLLLEEIWDGNVNCYINCHVEYGNKSGKNNWK